MTYTVANVLRIPHTPFTYPHFFIYYRLLFGTNALFRKRAPNFFVSPYFTCMSLARRRKS
jgi:hypothetical protein